MSTFAVICLVIVAVAIVAAFQCGYEIGEQAGRVKGGRLGYLQGCEQERSIGASEAEATLPPIYERDALGNLHEIGGPIE